MSRQADLDLIEDVVRRAASNTVKHHEVSQALQAFERLQANAAETLRKARAEAWHEGHETRKRNEAATAAGMLPFQCGGCMRGYVGHVGPDHAEKCRFYAPR